MICRTKKGSANRKKRTAEVAKLHSKITNRRSAYQWQVANKLVKVNPRNTSRECSACGHIDKANRDRERFICVECGHFDHADKQAARNIKRKAVVEYDLKLVKVPTDCGKPKQLNLFETPSTELTVLSPERSRRAKRRKHDTRKGKHRVPGNLGRQLELFSQDMWNVSSAESPF
ncbi:zinc ribbon domain-containing protein [Coleofasciculus sp. F4-SAH-05]|uniref:zinc ribbon domain-containing protein n=1 Tax=Coleofasciculus sp. F4-SAH-05 TaxID=3069525 RepID=UPI003304A3A0